MEASVRHHAAAWPTLPIPSRSRRPLSRSPRLPAVRSESGDNQMFVFGTGFVGRYVSKRLMQEGWKVSGTCTSTNKKRDLEEMGMEAFNFDVHGSELRSLLTLHHATHVLVSIPPIAGLGDPLIGLHEDLRSTLSCGNLQWLCYLSSTSVYGDCGGTLVDEDYPVNPKNESAKLRFAAEKGWLDVGREIGVAVNIFRLGGIYGPGRSALDTIIKRKTQSKEQKMRESRLYTARVHVADIYQAVKASFDIPSFGRIYNVVDDDPAPRAEVFAYARALIEQRYPNLINELPSDNMVDLKFHKGNLGGEKRVSNARLKNELDVRLLYPTYRSGLQSILNSWGPILISHE